MKKITALLLCALLALSAFVLVGCGETKEEALKLGLGVYSTVEKATNADGDTNGAGKAVITAAAVLVDANGKIVKCVLDTAENSVAYTSAGKAVANASFKTKYELGADYGMKAPYGSAKEWYEHADAFCALVVGKTASEVKALVAADGKNTDAVISAGCTIAAGEFVKAVEKAVANAKDSATAESNTLKLGVSTTQTTKDATEDKAGSNKLETTLFAASVDAEGKIVAATNETVEFDFTFDKEGKSTFDKAKAISGKRELGDSYGMKAPYGSAKEWYEHADAFVAACIGKKASEVASLSAADIQAAGCTIAVDGFIKAAAKVG